MNSSMYAARAEVVTSYIREGVQHKRSLTQSVHDLAEEYHDRLEDSPQLRRFTSVLLQARQKAHMQDLMNAEREKLHHGHLSHEELVAVGHHYEMLRHDACTYNHEVRELIEQESRHTTRAQLTEWMSRMSGGKTTWAEGEIQGAVSEVALHAALQGMSELRNVRYGSVEEDLQGYDFVAQWQGRLVTLDAKTGSYEPLGEQLRGHMHLEISVPREVVEDFRVTRQGLSVLRSDVRQALQESVGVQAHGSHAVYSV